MQLITWYKNRRWYKTRTHDLTYKVHIPTVQAHSWILLPHPVNTEYQQVTDVQINTNGECTKNDKFFAVRQATWATLQCSITVQPRQLNIDGCVALKLNDYIKKSRGDVYCQPDTIIQSTLPVIQQRAAEYRNKFENVLALLRALFDHTISTLRYGDPIAGLYTTKQALDRPQVDCGGFSTYLAALCRACLIPTRLVAGFWAGHKVNAMHAWLECLLPNGQWLPLDPSVEYLRQHSRTEKLGGFNLLGSDRIVMSTGSSHSIQVGNQNIVIDIMQTPLLIQATGEIEYVKDYQVITK